MTTYDSIAPIAIAILGGGTFGSVATGWFAFRRGLNKDKSDQNNILIASLIDRVTVLEAHNASCVSENAVLREAVGGLKEAVRRMEAELAQYRNTPGTMHYNPDSGGT